MAKVFAFLLAPTNFKFFIYIAMFDKRFYFKKICFFLFCFNCMSVELCLCLNVYVAHLIYILSLKGVAKKMYHKLLS